MKKATCFSLIVTTFLFFVINAKDASGQTAPVVSTGEGFVRLDRITASRAIANGIEIHSGAAIMVITAMRDDVIRVRVGPRGELPEDASWAVLPVSRTATVSVTDESSAAAAGFRTKKLRVSVNRDPLQLRVSDLDGHVLAEDLPGRPIEFNGTAFRIYRKSPDSEHYFGLGDKPGPLDRRNHAFSDWNTDVGWQESTDPIYKSIPFFITFRNGVAAATFLDNTWHTSFDFNKEYMDGYSFGAEDGPLDYYVLYGPDPKQVVEGWAWLVGTAPLPPMWSFGYQQSRYSYYPEAEVRRIAARLRAEKIPADVIWLDIDYQDHYRPFTVDAQRFPDFSKMIADLKVEHFQTVLITDLHIAYLPGQGYKPYDEGAGADYFVHAADGKPYVGNVWPGPAVFPDFTRKASRDWWGTLYKDFVANGVAGFWNDMNEPADFGQPSHTMPLGNLHQIEEPGFKTRTTTHLEVHNIFGMQNSRGTYEGLLKLAPGRRPFVMTRASFAGGQRYAVTWTGDNSSTWNHLRLTTPQLSNLGLSGFAMAGADVGGFSGSPQPELLTRWLEVAAFHPIDRDHTAIGTQPQEPWENGTAYDVSLRRRSIEERYRLMPYIYTIAEEMSRTGLPIMRPLFLEFPAGEGNNQPIDAGGTSFLLGPDLLVAPGPFPDESDDYTVTLPPVGWYDYWTGELMSAGRPVTDTKSSKNRPVELRIHPSLKTLPVLVRAGSIIPNQPLVESTSETPRGPLTLRVYPPLDDHASCDGDIYLDDGVSFAYKDGAFLRESFTCARTTNGLSVKILPRKGTFTPWWSELAVEIYGAGSNSRANTLGVPVKATYDALHHSITAVIPDDGKGTELQLRF